MAINPYTFIITPNQHDGIQRLSDPDGTDQPPTELSPVGNLTVGAVTHDSIAISWTYSTFGGGQNGFTIEYQRPGLSWQSGGTVGASARNYTQTGLSAGQLYRFRVQATASDGSTSAWAQVEASTEEAPQIPVGDVVYSPSRIPLRIINPRPINERTSKSRYSWTHSQVPYEVPICVGGGRPPFLFSISGAGFTIHPKAPAFNPGMVSWAEVHAPAGHSGSYTVKVTDIDGEQASVTVNVTRQDSKFRFFDANNGSDTASGNWGSPRKTNQGWYGASKSTVSPMGVDNIMVFLEGVYPFPYAGESKIQMGKDKPMCFIAMPGHDVEWASIGNATRHGFTNNEGGSGHHQRDWFMDGIRVDGKNEQGSLFKFNWSNDRMVWWRMHLGGVDFDKYTQSDVDNIGGIVWLGKENSVYGSVVDCLFEGFVNGRRTNTCGLQFYHLGYGNVDGCRWLNYYGGEAIYVKTANHSITLTGIDQWGPSINSARRDPCSFDCRTPTSGTTGPPGNSINPKNNKIQVRYSRLWTGSSADDVFRGTTHEDTPPNSAGYRDRCCLKGGIGNFARVPSNTEHVIQDCIHFGMFSPTINPTVTVRDTITVRYDQSTYLNYVEASGAAKGDQKYKKSFLVPEVVPSSWAEHRDAQMQIKRRKL